MRLHEIEINGLPAPVLTPMSDAEGNNVEAATDADATTFTSTNLPTTGRRAASSYIASSTWQKPRASHSSATTQRCKKRNLLAHTERQHMEACITPESKNGVVTFKLKMPTQSR